MRKTLNRIIIAWFALCANYLVSAQKKSSARRDDRKLVDIDNCDTVNELLLKTACQYSGTTLDCPSPFRFEEEDGLCGAGGRRHNCYWDLCTLCNTGYYKATVSQCNACSPVDNCDSNSVTCSSSADSVCTS